MTHPHQNLIDTAWEDRASLSATSTVPIVAAVTDIINALDAGELRVAAPSETGWVTHQWLKKAVLLSFRLQANSLIPGGPNGGHWFDKVNSKFAEWDHAHFAQAGFRAVPGAFVRKGGNIQRLLRCLRC